MKKKLTHYILFGLFMVAFVFPAIQKETSLIHFKRLQGYFVSHEPQPISTKTWFNQDFQKDFEKYLKDNIGFRPFFIRLKNQIDFNCFSKINALAVVKGKNNYLFETEYINSYNGKNFIGTDSIEKKVAMLKTISDSLEKHNTKLLVCIALGKGSFYPEYFPDGYSNEKGKMTNICYFKEQLVEHNINCIDFNSWFISMKDTSKYILYPKYGIHWSQYAMLLAADSLINYMENLLSINMADIIVDSIVESNKPRSNEYDMGNALNLFIKLPTPIMGYHEYHWENDTSVKRPKTIVISDSFFWQINNEKIFDHCFAYGGFWYYFKEAFPGKKDVNDICTKQFLEDQDIIILFGTEATFTKFPYGFEDKAYSFYYND